MQDIDTEKGRRLEQLLLELGLSQTSLAEAVPISASYINKVISGQKNMSARLISGITKNFPEVNIDWLLTGQGHMLKPGKESNGQAAAERPPAGITERREDELRVSELVPIIRGLEREVGELRQRVEMLERAGRSAGPGKE